MPLNRLLLTTVAACAAWACGGEITAPIIDDDGGTGPTGDGGGGAWGDADAPIGRLVPCDIERTQRVLVDGRSWTDTTVWYAELDDPSIVPEMSVRATMCELETFSTIDPCDGDFIVCSGDPPLDTLGCVTSVVEIEPGLIRAQCGRLVVRGDDSGETGRHGHRWTSVEFFLN